jgi:hypothetical protein
LEHPDVANNIYGFLSRQKITTTHPPVTHRTVLITLLAKNIVPVFFFGDVTLCHTTLFTFVFGSKGWDQLPSNCRVTMICAL